MILLTAATGPSGLAVLKHLVRRGASVRALVGKPASVEKAKAAGAAEALAGELKDAEVVREAMRGIQTVYFICPRFDPAEVTIGRSMIQVAREESVRLFVYHSVIHGQVDGLLHHRDKRIVEGLLLESLLDYAILQPTMYMQSTTRDWHEIVETAKFRLPQSTNRKMSVVDLEDVGEAGAIVATQPEFAGGCYELMNGERLTRAEMAAIMSEVLGQNVVAESRDLHEWVAHMRRHSGMTDSQLERIAVMQRHYATYGLSGGNGKVLGMILGRAPTGYRDYLKRLAAERPKG